MDFDVLIIGGGVAGMQCALVLGSAKNREYVTNKNIGIIAHQRSSHLKNALFNNVLGLPKGKLGSEILEEGKQQLNDLYTHISQIENEKVQAVLDDEKGFKIITNKNEYYSKNVVIAVNLTKPLDIAGLEQYVERHQRANVTKDRIQLKNYNHLIKKGLFVCGTLAGWASQYPIAAGSGASVAVDILTIWNEGTPTVVHDKI